MFIGNAHISMTKGDFVFAQWIDGDFKNFSKKVHELRVAGYRKIDIEHGFNDYHEYYRKKKGKRIITVTMMCV